MFKDLNFQVFGKELIPMVYIYDKQAMECHHIVKWSVVSTEMRTFSEPKIQGFYLKDESNILHILLCASLLYVYKVNKSIQAMENICCGW